MMGLFEHWPYTNFHNLNLDWIISKIKDFQADLKTLDEKIDDFSPEMQSYVNAWLEEHPEATTTVEDGSISYAKLSESLKDILLHVRVVDKFEDVADTTEDYVLVLNDDSYFGSGETVLFTIADHALTESEHLQRSNGDWMQPIPLKGSTAPSAPASAIGNTAASYINHSELTYGGTKTAFNDDCDNEIDCSTLAYLIAQGIDYNHSRYSGIGSNIIGEYAGRNIPVNPASLTTGRRAYNANEQALFYAEQNRLFELDYSAAHPVSQLSPGDLLFVSDPSGTATETVANRYLYIYHVSVVLAVYPNNDCVVVAQAGGSSQLYNQPVRSGSGYNVCKISMYRLNSSTADTWKYYARPAYGYAKELNNQIVKSAAFYQDVPTPASGGRRAMADLFLKEKLEKDKIYTLSVSGNFEFYAGQEVYLTLYIQSPAYNLYNCQIRNMTFSDKITFPFVPCGNAENITALSVSVWTPSGSTPTITEIYDTESVSIYKGLMNGAEASIKDRSNAINWTATVSSSRIWIDDYLHIDAIISADPPASDSFVTVGSISSSVMPTEGTSKDYCVFVGTRPARMQITTGGVIQIYMLTTDSSSSAINIDVTY